MSCGHKVRSGYTGGLEWRSVAQPYLGTAVSPRHFLICSIHPLYAALPWLQPYALNAANGSSLRCLSLV